MRIIVGSKNPVKVEAVREVLRDYNIFKDYQLISFEASSGISEQPKSLEETINGAINRANNSFNDCRYSFGIESGLMEFPRSKTGKMDICVCAIYDGDQICLGISRGFEFPLIVNKKIHEEGIDANEAFYLAGITNKIKIGNEEGAIGLLTKGRVSRKDYTKDAIQMALIQIENPELY